MTVVALAEATVDWLSLAPGKTIMDACDFYRYPGGNAANVAVGLARLGVPTRLVAKIGDDIHGQYLRQFWKECGVELLYLIEDKNHPTAQCYMTCDLSGEPFYRNWPKPNASQVLRVDELDFGMLSDTSFVHTTGVSLTVEPRRSAVVEFTKAACEAGSVICFDACFPTGQGEDSRQAALDILSFAHVVKVNLTELRFWSELPGDDMEECCRRLLKLCNPAILCVTLGDRGAVLYAGGKYHYFDAFPVECACDVGAGDAFISGLIFGLWQLGVRNAGDLSRVNKRTLRQAVEPALVCGAMVTRAKGATESFPSRAELDALVSELGTLVGE